MTTHAVNWHEGMFLRPHHFQTAHRFLTYTSHLQEQWNLHYSWGLRTIELDLESLGNHRCVVRGLQARFRDGTIVSIPEDGDLEPLDLKGALTHTNVVTVFLGLPVLTLGQANVASHSGEPARFLVDSLQLEDENTGGNPQPIQTRQLNLRLLLSSQDLAGYETIPLFRLQKSARAEAAPELDLTYIPPLIACDAWEHLNLQIFRAVYNRIGQKIDLLANQVVARGITFDSQSQGDPMILHQLRELNEGFCVLGVLTFAQGVHPIQAYLELCRIAGQLAIFGAARRAPELPKYDHDDLATCFFQVKHQIDLLLNLLVEPEYKERPFIGAGLRMLVALEPAWLESKWQLFIGVQSPLEPEQLLRLLTKGQLDMKVGSNDRVDTIFRQGLMGMRFVHAPQPPRALPCPPGQVYFQINRETQGEEWSYLQKSHNLAIRLNESFIAGNIQGQRILIVKHQGKTTPLQFTLYVVPADQKV